MDDFLAAVDTDQGVRIIIAGEAVFIPRRRLLAHLKLSQLGVEIGEATRPVEISALLIRYLSVAGLTDDQLQSASTYELLEAFFALSHLNSWGWLLPWLQKPGEGGEPEFYDYKGRRWAVWIHRMASRYGWPPETIWGLWPEEAAAYIQEIMVSEYFEREDKRALSELSYKYDKATKTSRFITTPQYSWMVDERLPEPVRTLVSTLPVGNVIKLEDD